MIKISWMFGKAIRLFVTIVALIFIIYPLSWFWTAKTFHSITESAAGVTIKDIVHYDHEITQVANMIAICLIVIVIAILAVLRKL